jgi:hypothetical protein
MVTQNYKQKGVAVFGFEADVLIIYAFVALAVMLTVISLLLPFNYFHCSDGSIVNSKDTIPRVLHPQYDILQYSPWLSAAT